jgi:hypothetical protein
MISLMPLKKPAAAARSLLASCKAAESADYRLNNANMERQVLPRRCFP